MPNVPNNNKAITNFAIANYVGVNKYRFKALLILASVTIINNTITKHAIRVCSTQKNTRPLLTLYKFIGPTILYRPIRLGIYNSLFTLYK